MRRTKQRSLLSSAATATAEVAALWMASLFVVGPTLVAARWCVGALGSTANFTLNRRWAFESEGTARAEALRYAATLLAAVTLSTLAFAALLRHTPLDPKLAHVTTMMTTWLLFTWPCLSRWVFPTKPTPSPVDSTPPPC